MKVRLGLGVEFPGPDTDLSSKMRTAKIGLVEWSGFFEGDGREEV